MSEDAHAEVYWSEPNGLWVVHRVRAGEIEAHEWVERADHIGDAVRRLLRRERHDE